MAERTGEAPRWCPNSSLSSGVQVRLVDLSPDGGTFTHRRQDQTGRD